MAWKYKCAIHKVNPIKLVYLDTVYFKGIPIGYVAKNQTVVIYGKKGNYCLYFWLGMIP